MNKLLLILCCAFFIACNNQAAPERDTDTTNTRTGSPAAGTALSTESELEILAECVDNAKDNAGNDLDDARAFALCRCILRQMQEQNPGADSTALVNYLTDTAQVAAMAKRCQ